MNFSNPVSVTTETTLLILNQDWEALRQAALSVPKAIYERASFEGIFTFLRMTYSVSFRFPLEWERAETVFYEEVARRGLPPESYVVRDRVNLAPIPLPTPQPPSAVVLNAYDIAVQRGFNGTVDQWLASLEGPPGSPGDPGPPGPPGPGVSLPGVGLVVATSGDLATREITGSSGITVVNGDGQSDDPINISLSDTSVSPGTYGGAGVAVQITVDQKGRLTSVTPIAISITAGSVSSGVFEVPRGGTGLSSLTIGSFIRGATSTTFEQRTAAQVLGDIGAVPTSRTVTAGTGMAGGGALSANITISLANTAVTPGTYGGTPAQTVSFQVDAQGRLTDAQVNTITIDASQVGSGTFGTSLITDDAITNAKLRNSAALSVIGRSANTTGDPADIVASTTGHALRLSGTTLGFGTLEAGAFASNTVPRTALANGTALTVIGRGANSTGAVADIAASADGNVLRRSGTTLGFGAIALASSNAVSGQLGRANGGLGVDASGWTTGNFPAANGSGGFNQRTPSQVITDGQSAAPNWSALHTFTGGVYDNGGMRVKIADYTAGGTLTTTDYYAAVSGLSGVTLPASPAKGQTLILREAAGSNCTVNRNGLTINFVAANYTLPANGTVRFVYDNDVIGGWLTFAG